MSMLKTCLRGRLRGFLEDERGMSVIEFAFIAPFLGIMTIGVADIGRGYIERYRLQQAANRTIEFAQQGTRANDYTFLKAEAAEAAGVPATSVTLTQWLECVNDNNTRTSKAFNGTCDTAQQKTRYVTIEIVKPFDPVFTTAGYPDVAANGTVPLKARATLRVQ